MTQRLDPYKGYSLRLWDGTRVYSGNTTTGLTPDPNVVDYRNGNDAPLSVRKLTGLEKYTDITLKRGFVQDPSFSNWASQVWSYGSSLGSEVSLANVRKNLLLEFYNEAGQNIVGWRIVGGHLVESPHLPPAGVVLHKLPANVAAIFEASLNRLRTGK